MKKSIYLLSFLLVCFSLTTQLVADAFFTTACVEMVENEDLEKESDLEKDIEKEKFSDYHSIHLHVSVSNHTFLSLNDAKTLSSLYEQDIIPPDQF